MISAGVVVYKMVDGQIHYLLLRNAKGHWDFPKGKIEQGEDERTAALRELQEEAGIEVEILDGFEASFDFIYSGSSGQKVKKIVHFFIGCAKTFDIKLSREHTDHTWLPFEQATESFQFSEQEKLLIAVNDFLKNC